MNIEKAKNISGWMSTRELEFLATNAERADTIVEFGSYLGRSTRALADNSSKKAIIYAVDPWNGEYYRDDGTPLPLFNKTNYIQFLTNLQDHIKANKVRIVRDYSYYFPTAIKADFVFIDGDHRYEPCYDDIMRAIGIVSASKLALVAGHDYGHKDWPGVKQAVDEVFASRVKVIDTIWYIELGSVPA